MSNAQLAGSIANAKLANSTISGIALGSNLSNLRSAANGGIVMTTYNGSAVVNDIALDIDGMTDIGADLVDADLIIVDDGANRTNREVHSDPSQDVHAEWSYVHNEYRRKRKQG